MAQADGGRQDGGKLKPRDLTIASGAAAGVFAALIGAGAFDIGTAAPWARDVYRGLIGAWAVAVLLLVAAAYRSSGAAPSRNWTGHSRDVWERFLRRFTPLYVFVIAILTAIALATSGSGFTRDTDAVRLSVTAEEFAALNALCGGRLRPDRIVGKVRVPSETEQFLIFDFSATDTVGTCSHSVEIPTREVLAIEER